MCFSSYWSDFLLLSFSYIDLKIVHYLFRERAFLIKFDRYFSIVSLFLFLTLLVLKFFCPLFFRSYCFTSDYDNVPVLVNSAAMTCPCHWPVQYWWLTHWSLWLYYFPLCHELQFTLGADFFYNFNAIEIVKYDISITLATKDINFVIDLGA